MAAGTLPWPSIRREVILAIRNYMLEEHGQMKSTITLPFLVDYIYYRNDIVLYPHLAGNPWDTIETRCGEAIRSMKWERYARRVYIVPYGPGGKILGGDAVAVEA